MKVLIKLLVVFSVSLPLSSIKASEFQAALDTIEKRKTAMQGIWHRIKRLSPYVELKETVEYNKELASEDAQEINKLLEVSKNLWSENSNLSAKGFTNATPAIWAIPDYFNKLYLDARVSANNLKSSIDEDNIDNTFAAMCNLGKACGTCHANFRRLLTNQLANEVSGWSGQYIKNCN